MTDSSGGEPPQAERDAGTEGGGEVATVTDLKARLAEAEDQKLRALAEAMRPFTSGSDYVNHIGLEAEEGADRIKAAFGANYDRLVALKNRYDPTNLFRHNQNIKPTV